MKAIPLLFRIISNYIKKARCGAARPLLCACAEKCLHPTFRGDKTEVLK